METQVKTPSVIDIVLLKTWIQTQYSTPQQNRIKSERRKQTGPGLFVCQCVVVTVRFLQNVFLCLPSRWWRKWESARVPGKLYYSTHSVQQVNVLICQINVPHGIRSRVSPLISRFLRFLIGFNIDWLGILQIQYQFFLDMKDSQRTNAVNCTKNPPTWCFIRNISYKLTPKHLH